MLAVLPALLLALPLNALAQEQSTLDRTVGARLVVSDFIGICIRTGGTPEAYGKAMATIRSAADAARPSR